MADYASLQELALADKGQDEAVTVNQRALIGTFLPSNLPPQLTLPRRQNPCPLCLRQHNAARTPPKRGRRKRNPRQNPLLDPLPATRPPRCARNNAL